MKNITIKQIYFDDSQRWKLDPAFSPHKNTIKSKYLENEVIRAWKPTSDYVGVFSYKFKQKMVLSGRAVLDGMEYHKGYDVYSFFSRWNKFNLWQDGDYYHQTKHFTTAGRYIFQKLGLHDKIDEVKTPIIYYNFWVARSEIYNEYVREVLNPAIELMENDGFLKSFIFDNANYRNYRNEMLNAESCKEVFGRTYYTYHPFICERLFGSFLACRNYKLKYLK